MYYETDEQYEEPPKHIVSIGKHEKGMKNAFFSPLTMKLNDFFVSKNHIPRGKRSKMFTFAYGQAVVRFPNPLAFGSGLGERTPKKAIF